MKHKFLTCKHVSIAHDKDMGYCVTVWRKDDMHQYFHITESSMLRLTLFTWYRAIEVTFHLSSVGPSFWFDYPEEA